MLGSAEGRSEAAGLVALPEETQDTILELNPKYEDQYMALQELVHTVEIAEKLHIITPYIRAGVTDLSLVLSTTRIFMIKRPFCNFLK